MLNVSRRKRHRSSIRLLSGWLGYPLFGLRVEKWWLVRPEHESDVRAYVALCTASGMDTPAHWAELWRQAVQGSGAAFDHYLRHRSVSKKRLGRQSWEGRMGWGGMAVDRDGENRRGRAPARLVSCKWQDDCWFDEYWVVFLPMPSRSLRAGETVFRARLLDPRRLPEQTPRSVADAARQAADELGDARFFWLEPAWAAAGQRKRPLTPDELSKEARRQEQCFRRHAVQWSLVARRWPRLARRLCWMVYDPVIVVERKPRAAVPSAVIKPLHLIAHWD